MGNNNANRWSSRSAGDALEVLIQILRELQIEAKARKYFFRYLHLKGIEHQLNKCYANLSNPVLGSYTERLNAFAQEHKRVTYEVRAWPDDITTTLQIDTKTDKFHRDFDKLNHRKHRLIKLFVTNVTDIHMAHECMYDLLLQLVPTSSQVADLLNVLKLARGQKSIIKIRPIKDFGFDENNDDHRQVVMGEGTYLNYDEDQSGIREDEDEDSPLNKKEDDENNSGPDEEVGDDDDIK